MNNIPLTKKIRLAFAYPQTTFHMILDFLLMRKIAPFPRMIGFYVTNACNLNCSMCINAKYRKEHARNSNLSINNAKKILSELKKYKPLIWFSGGEPLVNPDLIGIIELFSKEGLVTSMTTNGFILERYAKSIANSGLDFISLSLDSDTEKEHDEGRGVRGSFGRLMIGLRVLQKEKKITGKPINIKINSVLNRSNYFKLSQIYDFIETLDVDEWRIQPISYLTPKANENVQKFIKKTGIGEGVSGELIDKNTYFNTKEIQTLTDQLEEVKQKSKIYRTPLTIEPNIGNVHAYYQGEMPSTKSSCMVPFNQMTVYENGKVATGCLAWEIGTLDDGRTLKEMWHSKKAKYFRKLILTKKVIPPCFRCCSLDYAFN